MHELREKQNGKCYIKKNSNGQMLIIRGRIQRYKPLYTKKEIKIIVSYNEIDILAIWVECITFMDDITHVLKINKLLLNLHPKLDPILQYKAVNILQHASNYTKYFLNTNNIQLNSKKTKEVVINEKSYDKEDEQLLNIKNKI